MINRVVLMGRLAADPELKHTNSGTAVTSFRLAVERSYVAKGQERQADFFDIVAWRSTAEFVCRNFGKGSLIALDGQLQSRQYTAKDGQNRTVIEVITENVSFTGERRETPTNSPVSNEPPQGYDYTPNTYQTADAPPQYQQNVNGAAYSPHQQQGRLAPSQRPTDDYVGGVTPDSDLPWNRGAV